ncbi:MAG: hypothetical protein KF746_26045 [Chitinophagaceae bacterium]|nr:hypothetical protein [Chitinophagaceae bacterium]
MKPSVKNNIVIATAMIIALATLTVTAHAQKEGKKFSFGFGIEGIKPIGDKDLKEFYNFGGGLSLRFSYKAGPGYATLTGGALGILPKDFDDEELKAAVLIPVKAGYKYTFLPHLFAHGEVGYGRLTIVYAGEDDEIIRDPYGGFTYAATVGGNFGAFEIGLKYQSLVGLKSGGNEKSSLSDIGLRLGFNF